jgi:endonuclease/exonuclease/phosphatase (EEP) superfamily protein YafD
VKKVCQSYKGPIILAGDFNATAFSYQYQHLLDLTKLKDSNRGFGFQPTWHAPFAFIGIDNCFTTKDLVAVARHTGANINSDHLPLYVELCKTQSETVTSKSIPPIVSARIATSP